MASASGISRQRPLRAVRQTEIVCVQNLFDLADQRSRDVLMEMHGAEHRARAFLPAGVAARCAEPDPREPGTRRAGGEAGGDTRADRARLAARSRAERPTHTGNPHPISSDRAPESSGDSARSILRLGHITPATRRGTRCSRWTRSTRNCPAASTSSSSASTSAIEPPSRPTRPAAQDLPYLAGLPVGGLRAGVFQRQAVLVDPLVRRFQGGHQLLRADNENHIGCAPRRQLKVIRSRGAR